MNEAPRLVRPRPRTWVAGLWLSAVAAAAIADPAPPAQESLPPEALKALEQALQGFGDANISVQPMTVGPDGKLQRPDGTPFGGGGLGSDAMGDLFGRLAEARGEAAELGDEGLGLGGTPPPDALLATPSLAALSRADKLELLQLRSGQLLWATLDEPDEDRLYLTRLDTGGYLELPWGLLDPRQETDLRMRFGYIDVGVEEFTILADRIPLADGTELVGLITTRTSDALHIKTANSFIVLPLTRVGGAPTAVRVPARDIYTREELYDQKLTELRSERPRPCGSSASTPSASSTTPTRSRPTSRCSWPIRPTCPRVKAPRRWPACSSAPTAARTPKPRWTTSRKPTASAPAASSPRPSRCSVASPTCTPTARSPRTGSRSIST
ncbi:MAG: hypothetical protein ACYS26_13975 [Planctomycetota bacterium]|jgi:hypothetical protein